MPIYAKNTPNLLAIAKHSAEDSNAYEPGAIISIVFAAMAVEGFVNDFIAEVSWTQVDQLDPRLAQLREQAAAAEIEEKHTPLFRKIKVIHLALTGTSAIWVATLPRPRPSDRS
jgi:hypothetical protein